MLTQLTPLLKQAYQAKRGRPAKPKPVYVSRQVELAYTRELLAISALCQREFEDALKQDAVGDGLHMGDGLFGFLKQKFEAVKTKVKQAVDNVAEKLAGDIVTAQKRQSDKQLAEQLQKLTGIDLQGLLSDEDLRQVVDEAIAANVALIKSIPSQYSDKLEALILKGLQEGKRLEGLATDINALGQSTDKRAKLIARDQLGKINSRISQVRQEKLGVTHYTWSTSHDERVRHSHKLRDGKLFAWNDPPKDGHPGQAILCRCVALPYLDPLYDETAKKPEEVVKEQENDKIADEHTLASQRLLESKAVSGGLKSSDFPNVKDGNWGQGNAALRKSKEFFDELMAKNGKVPDVWAVHHYSIHSRHINDLLRGKPVADEFKSVSQAAVDRLDNLFSQDLAVVKKPFEVLRGDGVSESMAKTIADGLKSGKPVRLSDPGLRSATLDNKVADIFASRNATDGKSKAVYRIKLKTGAKAIDITPYHYYTGENEILLNRGSVLEVKAMKQREDGSYEIEAEVIPDAIKAAGDSEKQVYVFSNFPEDPEVYNHCNYEYTVTIG